MKNQLFLVSLTIFIVIASLIGCSSRELTKFSDNSSCSTTVEGNYFNELLPDSTSLQMIIGLQNTVTRRYSELILQPNEPFAYCVDPGEYKILRLRFVRNKTVEDTGYDYPEITFSFEGGRVNYFGNILVDYKDITEENVIVVPCRRNNKSRSAALGMFGLIGAVANAVASEVESADLYHVINIELDDTFLPEANLPVTEVNISVKAKE